MTHSCIRNSLHRFRHRRCRHHHPLYSQAFTDGFQKMRGRLSETGFEELFEELCEKFPTAEEYLRHLYRIVDPGRRLSLC